MKKDLQRDILERWRPVGTPVDMQGEVAPQVRRPLASAVWAGVVVVLLGIAGRHWGCTWLLLGVPAWGFVYRLLSRWRNF
jgi:hypothetical protein